MDRRKFMRIIEKKADVLMRAHCFKLLEALRREALLWKQYTVKLLSSTGHYPNQTENPFKRTGRLSNSMHYEVRSNCKEKKKPPYTIQIMNQWDELQTEPTKKGKVYDYSNILNQWVGKPFAGFKDRADKMLRDHTRDILKGH